jgi:lipoprotein-releasing system permease protein
LFPLDNHRVYWWGFGLLFGYLFSVIIDNIPFETTSLPMVKTYPVDYNLIYYIIGISFALARQL